MKTHIPLSSQSARRGIDVAALIAMYRDDFGVTLASAVRLGGATSDADEPDEPVVSQRDLDDRAETSYERWLDRDSRRCA